MSSEGNIGLELYAQRTLSLLCVSGENRQECLFGGRLGSLGSLASGPGNPRFRIVLCFCRDGSGLAHHRFRVFGEPYVGLAGARPYTSEKETWAGRRGETLRRCRDDELVYAKRDVVLFKH